MLAFSSGSLRRVTGWEGVAKETEREKEVSIVRKPAKYRCLLAGEINRETQTLGRTFEYVALFLGQRMLLVSTRAYLRLCITPQIAWLFSPNKMFACKRNADATQRR